MVNVFAVPVFFICFRECLETSIIVSVLLAFLKQTLGPDQDPTVYKKLRRQVWVGIAAGLVICLAVGGGFIGAFYGYGVDHFAGTEDIWEGAFSLVAAIIITLMGAALLRVSKLQDKWRVKLAQALEAKNTVRTGGKSAFKLWCEKYAMFILPFITVLREGLEAVIFIGGVSLGYPATAFPLAVICGLGCGVIVGFIIYKFGNVASLQIFLIISTCFLYLVAAGLLSKGVWALQNHKWSSITGGDAAEAGSGPGSYDIRQSVWHVNCCNAELNGGWGIFNSVFGWENSATYGSVISYNLYWVVVILGFLAMGYNERTGHWPLCKPSQKTLAEESDVSSQEEGSAAVTNEEKVLGGDTTQVRQIDSQGSDEDRATSR